MPENKLLHSLLVRGAFALLILLASLSLNSPGQTQPENAVTSSVVKVTHVLGFENVPRNLSGELLILDQSLHFQRYGSASAQVSLASIENVYLGEQDKQVGGVPMTLGKAAVPFGGGRVVSLFSHKKYDSVVLEYRDSQGGFHGAIFRLPKGQGETFRNALITNGAHIVRDGDAGRFQGGSNPLQAQRWSVQVDRIDPGTTTIDPCFSDAVYENLVRSLNQSKQFQDVFRSGDRNANRSSAVLTLRTVVEKFSPGSETRRAVMTVGGATKLKVHIQLVTQDGHVVLERTLEGNVRFIGDNLGATSKVAANTAKTLKQSKLPVPANLIPQQASANEAKTTS